MKITKKEIYIYRGNKIYLQYRKVEFNVEQAFLHFHGKNRIEITKL